MLASRILSAVRASFVIPTELSARRKGPLAMSATGIRILTIVATMQFAFRVFARMAWQWTRMTSATSRIDSAQWAPFAVRPVVWLLKPSVKPVSTIILVGRLVPALVASAVSVVHRGRPVTGHGVAVVV